MRTRLTAALGVAAMLATMPAFAGTDYQCRVYAQQQVNRYLADSLGPQKACPEYGTINVAGVFDASPLGCVSDDDAIYGVVMHAYWSCRSKLDGPLTQPVADLPKFFYFRQ